jgi:hypothetical protein
MSFLEVLDYFRRKAGSHFEPRFVEAFLKLPVPALMTIMQPEGSLLSTPSKILLPDDLTILALEQELLNLGVDAYQHPFSQIYERQQPAA